MGELSIIYTDKPLPRRYKNDLYPTPVDFCRASIEMLPISGYTKVLDPGAGLGAWGKAVREKFGNKVTLTGVDIDDELDKSEYYDNWIRADYLTLQTDEKFDLIVGNPPYTYAEEFVRKSLKLLSTDGDIMFLLRLAFLESQDRGRGLWQEYKPTQVFVSSRRLSFTGNRKSDNTAYGLYLWSKFDHELYNENTMLDWINWDYSDDVIYHDLGGIRVYKIIDNYFIHPETGDIYDIENFTTKRA